MRVLTMEPERVFWYFEEISCIPRGSGNTKAVSDYCTAFAREQGLAFVQDSLNNVIIFKPASAGREQEEPVILQGHLDMVCEKNLDCAHDFFHDGLLLQTDGVNVFADGTTLGGDDGIAVAYMLALLESDSISHPPLEAVFTVDEETGMFGAAALDTSVLKGKRLINLDSEEEGVLLTSCAGGVKCSCRLPVEYVEVEKRTFVRIKISGLQGGHSGTEIDKGRCNANKLMGRLLFSLNQKMDISIASLEGGLQDNAIPRETVADAVVKKEDVSRFMLELEAFQEKLRAELTGKEPELSVNGVIMEQEPAQMLSPVSMQKLLFLLVQCPNGVQEMSQEIAGLVEISLNLGVLRLSANEAKLDFALRSSIGTAKEALRDKLAYLVEFLGGECVITGDYPAWEYKRDSRLRKTCVEAFCQVYGREPEIAALHAGLECGILADKIEGFDAVSMGPDIFDIHTPKERMSISSVQKTWTYLQKILELA